jgi:hypothetical protein
VVNTPLYRRVARSGQTHQVGGLGVQRRGTPRRRPTGSAGCSRGDFPVVSAGGRPQKLRWSGRSCPLVA